MTLQEALALAHRYYQDGLFANVREVCNAILGVAPDDDDTLRLLAFIDHPPPSQPRPAGYTVLWQTDPTATAWSLDWIREVTAPLAAEHVFDGTHTLVIDKAIVVDCRLSSEKLKYYRTVYRSGARFALMHLSDESYQDDTSVYDYCDCIIRNYWSVAHKDSRKVLALPLGYKSGVGGGAADRPASTRGRVWTFVGDVAKTSRQGMLQTLGAVPGGFTHLASGFVGDGALDAATYRAVLEDTIFAPCPAGYINLDTFRLYEALECGCIPIVERRGSYDYFTCLFGEHPLPTISRWDDAVALMNALGQNPIELERRRHQCTTWWRHVKQRTGQDIATLLDRTVGTARDVFGQIV